MSRWKRCSQVIVGLLCLSTVVALSSCGDSRCTGVSPVKRETLSFLFRYCWNRDLYGDCSYTHFWYFEYDSDGARYAGDWYAGYQEKNPPDWWEEAGVGWLCYRERDGCLRGSWPDNEDIATTPMADQEAEEIALWLSGSLVAPESLYDEVLTGLNDVRDTYGDMLPRVVELTFKPPWLVSRIELWLTPEAMERYERGEYCDLDSLNASLGLLGMSRLEDNWFWLRFEGRLNPERLVEIYEDVESVLTAAPIYFHNTGSLLVPWVVYPG